jgi:xylan 1,4-beta-xylosidase
LVRQPHETWWSQSAGALRLTPRPDTLSGKTNPTFLARRVQHARFDASTELTVPAEAGVSAGLAIFQSETHHFYFGVRRTTAGLVVFLERWNGKQAELVASSAIPEAAHLKLSVKADETVFSFSYAQKEGSSESLAANVDSTPVTVQAAGGGLHFTGAVIGLHSRIEP